MNHPHHALLCAAVMAWAEVLIPAFAASPAADTTAADGKSYDNSRSALGAQLVWLSENQNAGSEQVPLSGNASAIEESPLDFLISDDETLSPRLPSGTSLFVLKTRAPHQISSFSFFNHGAAGTYRVSALANSQWKPISKTEAFSNRGSCYAAFLSPVMTSHIRVEFDTTQPGQISGFGIAGDRPTAKMESVRLVQQPDIDVLNSVIAPSDVSSIVAVSPGDTSSSNNPDNMIDDLVETSYHFDPSGALPAVLLDLGEARQIERVTALVETDQPLHMEVYLPETPENVMPSAPPSATTTLLDSVLARGPRLASTTATPGIASWLAAAAASYTTLVYQPGEKPGGLEPILFGDVAPGESRVILPLGRTFNGRFVLIVFRPTGAIPGNLIINEINLLGRYIWRFWDDFGPAEGPGESGESNSIPVVDLPPPPVSP